MRLSNDDLTFIADALITKKHEAESGLTSAAQEMDLDSIRRYSENLAQIESIMQKLNKRLNPTPKQTDEVAEAPAQNEQQVA